MQEYLTLDITIALRMAHCDRTRTIRHAKSARCLLVERNMKHADIISAAQHGDVDGVRSFLASSLVDVNIISDDEMTPLHWAVQNGHLEVVRVLLEDPKINANESDSWLHTPLHLAIDNTHTEILRLLLKSPKVDANKGCFHFPTP
eukprot:491140_1